MIINSSAVLAESAYSYQKTTTVSVKSETRTEMQPVISAANSEEPAAIFESSDKGNKEKSFSDALQKFLEDNNSNVSNVGKTQKTPFASSPDDAKLTMLKMLIAALIGKKYKPEKMQKDLDIQTNEPRLDVQASQSRQMPTLQRAVTTKSLTVDYQSSISESVSYSAKGLINTADGRQISVDLNLSMSREVQESLHLEVFSTQQQLCDPLIINYGGTSASLSDEKFDFDLTMDGETEKISFAGEGSGFLAYDKNGDGIVNDGSELFGPQSGNGFDELRKYDSDKNGWIDEADDIFQKLTIWTKDKDGNDKMLKLSEADIGAIFLGETSTQFTLDNTSDGSQNGQIRSTSFFLKESGGAGYIQHVDLAY